MIWEVPKGPNTPNLQEEYVPMNGDDETILAQKRLKRKQLAQMDVNVTLGTFKVYAQAPGAIKY